MQTQALLKITAQWGEANTQDIRKYNEHQI